MTTTSILPAPHGVDVAGAPRVFSTGSRLKRIAAAVWRALQASGHSRAMRELRALHGEWEIGDAELLRRIRAGAGFVGSRGAVPHR